MPAHPEEDPNVLREIQRRDRGEAERIELERREVEHRRAEAIQRSQAAIWRFIAAEREHRESITQADEGADQVEAARIEIRDALVDAAIAWLEEKWGYDRHCPYCGTLDWSVSSPMDDYLWDEGPISAHFEVTCGHCAHTVFINAFKAGLLPETPAELAESPLEKTR